MAIIIAAIIAKEGITTMTAKVVLERPELSLSGDEDEAPVIGHLILLGRKSNPESGSQVALDLKR